jgi:hypothetical protein
MMAKEYFIECECGKEVEFNTDDIDGLDDYIAAECKGAAADAESQFDGMVDPTDLPIQPRMIHDLSQAIASGDLSEARILLDRIAYELGNEHSDACQIGRFAKVPV